MYYREFISQMKQYYPNATVEDDSEGELIINTGMYLVADDDEPDFVVLDNKPDSVIVTKTGR